MFRAICKFKIFMNLFQCLRSAFLLHYNWRHYVDVGVRSEIVQAQIEKILYVNDVKMYECVQIEMSKYNQTKTS